MMSNTNSRITTLSTFKVFERPGARRSPCIAILYLTSDLQLVNLDGNVSGRFNISDNAPPYFFGIVTVDDEVYAVTDKEIVKILVSGKGTKVADLQHEFDLLSKVVVFRSQIYIIQPYGKNMVRFNPSGGTFNSDLLGCPLGCGFTCCASDSLIYAMGGSGTETTALEYNPSTNTWTNIASMRHERVDASSAVITNRVYVLSRIPIGDPPECFDPHSGTWCEIPGMNVQGVVRSACVIGNTLHGVVFKRGDYTIEVYKGRKWKTMTSWNTNSVINSSCVWPYSSGQQKHPPDDDGSENQPNDGLLRRKVSRLISFLQTKLMRSPNAAR